MPNNKNLEEAGDVRGLTQAELKKLNRIDQLKPYRP